MMAPDEDRSPEAPLWYVTYGDMMTLLLTFFIMIASFSEVKEQEKYQAIATSIHRQFGATADKNADAVGWTRPRNGVIANMATQARTEKHELLGEQKESQPSVEQLSPNILRTKEFLEQELGIPAERIRVSAGSGDEDRVEIFLKKSEEEKISRRAELSDENVPRPEY